MKYHFQHGYPNPGAAKANAKAKTAHQEAIDANMAILADEPRLKQAYPTLRKVIGRKLRYLIGFHSYARTKFISHMALRKDGGYYFFGSCRYLASTFGGSFNTWNRNVNLFVTLGLITKHQASLLSRHTSRRSVRHKKALAKTLAVRFGNTQNQTRKLEHKFMGKLKEIGFYSIPQYDVPLLIKADDVAKTMRDNGFRTNAFSKVFLIKTFGSDFAHLVFPDERTVTGYSDYVANEIEAHILREIENKGYTTKQETIDRTNINLARVHRGEYGFIRGDRKAILAREFDRNHKRILASNGLVYQKVNRAVMERFGLTTYAYLIYRPF